MVSILQADFYVLSILDTLHLIKISLMHYHKSWETKPLSYWSPKLPGIHGAGMRDARQTGTKNSFVIILKQLLSGDTWASNGARD